LLLNIIGVGPMAALFWTSVFNGILAPPLLLVTNNKAIMGDRANGLALNVVGWLTVALMFAAAGAFVLTWGRMN
jgi:Mn2+/Fe2+ NRAMP family transporter